jgi:uncharacterized protein (DUF697 family)
MPSLPPNGYETIIYTAAKAAAGVGVAGAIPGAGPAIDIAGMSVTWVTMLGAISENAGKPMSSSDVKQFIATFGKGAVAYLGGTIVMRQLLHFIPGVGTLGVMGINAAFNATYTYKLGCQFASYFEKEDFDPDDLYNLIDDLISHAVPTVGDIVGTVKALSTW